MLFEPMIMKPGDALIDAFGNPSVLEEGVVYRPSGCFEQACAQAYSGDQPVQMDAWVIRFHLKEGLLWSNGNPLTADDSVYSYEVAEALYPAALPTLIQQTHSYQAQDNLTVEWRGVPGYLDGDIAGKFFSPLPRTVWGALKPEELGTAEVSARTPLGWGAYQIQEWVGGDHITLQKNPNYFHSAEGLPAFDILTFRFMPDGSEAVDALRAGECDLVDPNAVQDIPLSEIQSLQEQAEVNTVLVPETAWEQILLGVDPLDEGSPRFFAAKEVRQAVALCIDRQALAEQLFGGLSEPAQAYVSAENPFFNPDAVLSSYDPEQGQDLLQKSGWVDLDNNPQTPRISQGVTGLPDNTAFSLDYLVSPEAQRQAAAKAVQADLAKCGIEINLVTQESQQYLEPGPDGPVFGRHFQMAQFAWPATWEPPCYLYTSDEVPGPYPDYPKAWGGVNAAGYTNPAYDVACRDGRFTLAESSLHTQAYFQAQATLAEDLPAIPLYWYFKSVLTRPDFCGLELDASTQEPFWNIEVFNYGEGCK